MNDFCDGKKKQDVIAMPKTSGVQLTTTKNHTSKYTK